MTRGEWAAALPLLAKGSDSALKDLSRKELQPNPAPAARVQIADGWWTLAEKQPEPAHDVVRRHAVDLYTAARPGLTGAEAARVDARLPNAAVGSVTPGAGTTEVTPAPTTVASPAVGRPLPGGVGPVRAFPVAEGPAKGAQLSPDLRRVLVVAKHVTLFDLESGAEVATWAGWQGQLLPDGKRLVVEVGGKWRAIEAETGKESGVVADFPGGRGVVSADGSKLFVFKTGDKDPAVAVYDLKAPSEPKKFNRPPPADHIGLSTDGKDFAAAPSWTDFVLHVCDTATGKELWRAESGGGCDQLAFSRDGTRLLRRLHANPNVAVYDAKTGTVIAQCVGTKRCTDAALSSTGRFLVTAADDAAGVHLFDLGAVDKGKAKMLDWPQQSGGGQGLGTVNAVALSPDDHRVLAACKDKTLRLIDVQTGKQLAKFDHEGEILFAAFSPDGRLAVSGDEKAVRVWRLPDPAGGKPARH